MRGIGDEKALIILKKIGDYFNVPVVTSAIIGDSNQNTTT